MVADQCSSELRQQQLRAELKTWEREFSETNGGRKAGKSDIKSHPDIAAKYKEYNKLRAKADVAERQPITIPPKKSPRKRSSDEDSQFKTAPHPSVLDPYDVPISASNTPRIVRTAIGPTPQKNGQVLGLFDMLSPESVRTLTPLKLKIGNTSTIRGQSLVHTPSKRRSGQSEITIFRDAATPGSSAKKRCLGLACTPSSKRQQGLSGMTPSANRLNAPITQDNDQTPAFLKRFSDPGTLENSLGEDIKYSPRQLRLPRKPVGRTLSQLVQECRDQEDDRLDEEMALMRELETGESAPARPKLQVQDSQLGDLPLGADGEHETLQDEGDELPDEKFPRRLWKKKGQKRTTRRANIGVNRAKWKPEAKWAAGEAEDASGDESAERITETQRPNGHGDEDAGSDAEFEGENKAEKKDGKSKQNTENKGKKSRKINPNATAHANFRSLKIRNKNSKGKKGGRFGRR